MIPQVVLVGPLAAANATLFYGPATPTSGTLLVLSGSQPDAARKILLTYGNEVAPRTLVVTGTNHTGNSIQETLAVPSGGAGTAATTQDFLTIVSAMPGGGGWSANISLGTNAVASSPWMAASYLFGPFEWGFAGVVSGTANWTVEFTLDEFQAANGQLAGPAGRFPPAVNSFTVPALTALAANAMADFKSPMRAWRATLNSGTGSITVTGVQSGTNNVR